MSAAAVRPRCLMSAVGGNAIQSEAISFSLDLCGTQALALLCGQAPLRVTCVFDRSFYLKAGPDYACLGVQEIELGPLNGRLDTPNGMNWAASGLREGARCIPSPGAIHLGGRFTIDLRSARTWRPDAAPARLDPALVLRALDRLPSARIQRTALDDLATGRDATAEARRWLAKVFGSATNDTADARGWVSGLIGLGPGLTPSGDDFIGGVLIALHALGGRQTARRLAALSLPLAASASNGISRAHLAAAAEGQGSAALHRFLNDVLLGDCGRMDAILAALGRIGHSSGWDGLAGTLAVLRAWSKGSRP